MSDDVQYELDMETVDAKIKDGDVEPDELVEDGRRKVKKLMDPKLPSKEEVKEHYASGHMPYRSWCHHCVRGRGRERAHQRRGEEERQGIPEYHLDYCFPGDEFDHRLTVLVVIERYTKMKKAVVAPSKGSTGRYATQMILELINECGDKGRDIILKTDQEPAIKFVVDDVCVNRTGARTVKEVSPKGSKGSNGIVERAVQAVETILRANKSSLDERLGVQVDVQHPVLTWLCEYVSFQMNRLEVASDGKTPYERVKGKRAEVLGLEFGEKILWKHHPGKRMEKLNARWGYGLFLGVRPASGELIVVDGDSKELKYVRTVKRVPEEQRWDPNNMEWITMVPWNRGGADKEADGDLPEFDVKKGPGRQLTEEEMKDITTSEAPRLTHRAHLRKADFDKHGYTDRCAGCSAMLRGLHVQPHSRECRARMEEILKSDVRIKNAKARMQERTMKVKADSDEKGVMAKRRKLEEIEDQTMREEDPEKLADLFEKYRVEYTRERDEKDGGTCAGWVETLEDSEILAMEEEDPAEFTGRFEQHKEKYLKERDAPAADDKRRKTNGGIETEMKERATGSSDPAVYEEMEVGIITEEFSEEMIVEMMACWIEGTGEYAWDDVNNIALPLQLVKEARKEEMGHMKGKIFKVVKKAEAWEVTGKAPISTKWVDTDKTHGTKEPEVRSRWVARDFKNPNEKDREDLFSATPPIELMRLMLSRQATRRKDYRERKTMYLDVKKAHLEPLCEQDVYVDLPAEAEVRDDECGKLVHWLYGCRPAAQAWEEHYSALLGGGGFRRMRSVPVAFVHEKLDLMGVVHGDDFVFVGLDEDLDWVLSLLRSRYEVKNRGRLGTGPKDVREIDMLGRIIRVTDDGVSWEGDPRHQDLLEEYFGLDVSSKTLSKNGYADDREQGGKEPVKRA